MNIKLPDIPWTDRVRAIVVIVMLSFAPTGCEVVEDWVAGKCPNRYEARSDGKCHYVGQSGYSQTVTFLIVGGALWLGWPGLLRMIKKM